MPLASILFPMVLAGLWLLLPLAPALSHGCCTLPDFLEHLFRWKVLEASPASFMASSLPVCPGPFLPRCSPECPVIVIRSHFRTGTQ